MAKTSFLKLVIVIWLVTQMHCIFSMYFAHWEELRFCFGENSNYSNKALIQQIANTKKKG